MRARVYVGGTFDLFHSGHVELLRRAHEYGDVLVALNTDRYAGSFKKRPVMTYAEREAVLRACRYVRDVLPCHGNERQLLAGFGPDYIVYAVSGSEYTRESYLERLKITEQGLHRHRCELVFLDYTEGVSSTDVVARILQRHRGEPCEPDRASQDARQPDVPDAEAGRGRCACECSGCRRSCSPA